jgi:hypothetical protein
MREKHNIPTVEIDLQIFFGGCLRRNGSEFVHNSGGGGRVGGGAKPS